MIASSSHQTWLFYSPLAQRVITKNLFSIARYQQRRRDHDQVS